MRWVVAGSRQGPPSAVAGTLTQRGPVAVAHQSAKPSFEHGATPGFAQANAVGTDGDACVGASGRDGVDDLDHSQPVQDRPDRGQVTELLVLAAYRGTSLRTGQLLCDLRGCPGYPGNSG
jgi:hypothetical protein